MKIICNRFLRLSRKYHDSLYKYAVCWIATNCAWRDIGINMLDLSHMKQSER